MKQPLPPIYAVDCVADRWHTIARSERPHHRALERAELRAGIGPQAVPLRQRPSLPARPPALLVRMVEMVETTL